MKMKEEQEADKELEEGKKAVFNYLLKMKAQLQAQEQVREENYQKFEKARKTEHFYKSAERLESHSVYKSSKTYLKEIFKLKNLSRQGYLYIQRLNREEQKMRFAVSPFVGAVCYAGYIGMKKLRTQSIHQASVNIIVFLFVVYFLPKVALVPYHIRKAYPPDEKVVYERLKLIQGAGSIEPRAALHDLEYLGRRLWPHQKYELQAQYKYLKERGVEDREQSFPVFCYNVMTKILPQFLKKRIDDKLRERVDQLSSVRKFKEVDLSQEIETELKFEKEFQHQDTGKFKVQIYEGGRVEIQCIDSFQKVFGLSPDVLKSCSLIDLLSPTLCKEHRLVVNALFSVMFDLATMYVDQKPKPRERQKKEIQAKEEVVLKEVKVEEKSPRERALEKLVKKPEVQDFLEGAEIAKSPENIKQKQKRELVEDLQKVKEEQDKPKQKWPRF